MNRLRRLVAAWCFTGFCGCAAHSNPPPLAAVAPSRAVQPKDVALETVLQTLSSHLKTEQARVARLREEKEKAFRTLRASFGERCSALGDCDELTLALSLERNAGQHMVHQAKAVAEYARALQTAQARVQEIDTGLAEGRIHAGLIAQGVFRPDNLETAALTGKLTALATAAVPRFNTMLPADIARWLRLELIAEREQLVQAEEKRAEAAKARLQAAHIAQEAKQRGEQQQALELARRAHMAERAARQQAESAAAVERLRAASLREQLLPRETGQAVWVISQPYGQTVLVITAGANPNVGNRTCDCQREQLRIEEGLPPANTYRTSVTYRSVPAAPMQQASITRTAPSLSGRWRNSVGRDFVLADDGRTVSIAWISNGATWSLHGELARSSDRSLLRGSLRVNSRTMYEPSIATFAQPLDASRLRIWTSDWPRVNTAGFKVGICTQDEVWERVDE